MKKLTKQHLLVFKITLYAYLSLFTAITNATVRTVPEEFTTIQSAINASSALDTVLIVEGNYYESLSFPTFGLTLAGEWLVTGDTASIATTKILGDSSNPIRRAIRIPANYEEPQRVYCIAGLTVEDCDLSRASPLEHGAGIFATYCTLVITSCNFTNNSASTGGALAINHSNLTLYNCYFDNNTSTGSGGAVSASSSSIVIHESIFINNRSELWGNSLYANTSSGSIVGSYFSTDSIEHPSGAVRCTTDESLETGPWLVEDCDFVNNHGSFEKAPALQIDCYLPISIINNRFIGNIGHNTPGYTATSGAIAVHFSPIAVISENRFTHNRSDQQVGCITMGSHGIVSDNRFSENEARSQLIMALVINWDLTNYLYPRVNFQRNICQNNHFIEEPNPEPIRFGCITNAAGDSASLTVTECDFISNEGMSVSGRNVAAINNYWGSPNGPYEAMHHTEGTGDTLQARIPPIPFEPYATHSFFAPRAELTPADVQFGQVSVDSNASQVVQLQNLGFDTLVVDLFDLPEPVFTLPAQFPIILGGLDSTQIIIEFRPNHVGDFLDWMTLTTNNPDQPFLSIPFSGTGVPPNDASCREDDLPTSLVVFPPTPNPFNTNTSMRYGLPRDQVTTISLHDVLGRRVAILSSGVHAAGFHSVILEGSCLSSGQYFVVLRTEELETRVQRVTLLK
ncbi:hypothetical protein KQI63_13395 [bacterium]|nr:hypothetical protein [bacterium]